MLAYPGQYQPNPSMAAMQPAESMLIQQPFQFSAGGAPGATGPAPAMTNSQATSPAMEPPAAPQPSAQPPSQKPPMSSSGRPAMGKKKATTSSKKKKSGCC